ncbi:hypothetical protein V2J09_024017 [Rumex salicifolius]
MVSSPSEEWMKEYNEGLKLRDEIDRMVAEAKSFSPTRSQTQSHFSTTRRKITILKTKLQTLEILRLQIPSSRRPISEKEMDKRKAMLENVRSNAEQMENTLNSYCPARRDWLLFKNRNSDEMMKKASDMNNHGVIALQRQIIKVQDEDLKKLEETVISTKHIALNINEELNLQTKLLDTFDDDVESTGFRLEWMRLRLGFFEKRTKDGSWSLFLAALAVAFLIVVIVALIKVRLTRWDYPFTQEAINIWTASLPSTSGSRHELLIKLFKITLISHVTCWWQDRICSLRHFILLKGFIQLGSAQNASTESSLTAVSNSMMSILPTVH